MRLPILRKSFSCHEATQYIISEWGNVKLFGFKWFKWILRTDREIGGFERTLRTIIALVCILALLFAFIIFEQRVGAAAAAAFVLFMLMFLIWRARRMPKSKGITPLLILPTQPLKRRGKSSPSEPPFPPPP